MEGAAVPVDDDEVPATTGSEPAPTLGGGPASGPTSAAAGTQSHAACAQGRRRRRQGQEEETLTLEGCDVDKVPDASASGTLSHTWGKCFVGPDGPGGRR